MAYTAFVRNHSQTPLSRPLVGLVSILLLALTPACRKDPGPPSEAYEQAHKRFSKLYAQKLDEAFADPEMDEIEALLQQVPSDSIDASSARELQKRISDGRARVEQARQEQEEAIASARQVDVEPSEPGAAEEAQPEPTPAEPTDAGTVTEGPVVGSSASELRAGYLGCFQSIKPITVKDKGPREAWEMSTRVICSQSFPAFVGQVILVEDGKVLAVLPKSAVQVTWVLPDGGTTTGPTPAK